MATVRQLPARVDVECVAGDPFTATFTASSGVTTFSSAACTMTTGGGDSYTTDPGVPTASASGASLSTAWSAADTTALNTTTKPKVYKWSTKAVADGGSSFQWYGGTITVHPVGTTGVSTSTTVTAAVTVGGVSVDATITAGTGAAAATSLADTFGLYAANNVEAALRELPSHYRPGLSAAHFGAKGDGTTDDTDALQDLIDHCSTNRCVGYLDAGTYKITSALVFPKTPSYGLEGCGQGITIISQATDNTPVIDLGSTGSSEANSLMLRKMTLTYASNQSSSNTNAIALKLSAEIYFSEISDIYFDKCAYGIKCGAVGTPWATMYDELDFGGSISIAAIDYSSAITAGPNQVFGRIGVNFTSMTGDAIYLLCSTATFANIEFFATPGSAGPTRLFRLYQGMCNVGSMSVENGVWGSGAILVDCQAAHLNVGQFRIFSVTATGTPSPVSIFRGGAGGSLGHIQVGHIYATATSLSGETVLFNLDNTSPATARVGAVNLANGWTLQSTGYTTAANRTHVAEWANGQLSADKGDASYTFAVGDPTIVHFGTTFTAQRTVTLPSKTGNNLFSGLAVKIITDGAVNGSNTLVVKEGSNTLRTETNDKRALTYTYRRNAWVLTGYETLP